MDICKLKWTRLQNGIFRFLCIKVGVSVNQREIARMLKVSPTAVAKSLIGLEKEQVVNVKKEKNINLSYIGLNRDNPRVIESKQIENLKMIYESKIVNFLEEKFPGSTIILFGSYSKGEDTINSDIDIAIIGNKEKFVKLDAYEKVLSRKIIINFYDSFNKIHKNLKENLYNGIVLVGGIEL